MAGIRVLLCLGALLARQGSADLGALAIGEVHENVTLHCGNMSGARGLVTWYRNDSELIFLLSSNSSLPPASPRFSLEDAGALHVEALSLEDEGNYTCQEVLNETHWFPVWLRVASGPDQIVANISATGTLSNGTLYTAKGSQVNFSCHSISWPPPEVEWCIQADIPESLGRNLTVNSFALLQMSQNLQGNYTCLATNVLSGRQRKVTTELLVYWPPPLAPQCSVAVSSESATLELTCNWDGGYPDPTFLWTEEPGGTVVGNSKLKTLSPSQLSEGKKFRCVGSHIVGPELGASCVVQISSPLLDSQPMKTCFMGGNASRCDLFTEPLNIGGIVGTVVSLLLLGLAIVAGLMLYYSPVFCWKAGSTFRGQDMGDIMVLVDSEGEDEEEEEKEDKEDVEEAEQETYEREELPKEIHKHGHIHRVTALVNGNLDHMGNGLQELHDDSDDQQSDVVEEEDKPV
ncbi:V-set and immunoglobulin domain-containing protein 10 [Cricetulus griseus]|nr:V-set and immunoglobulin domain-containing protein 10 [Cricetulus griseus]